ncbi:MAG: hypothetical protein BWY74_03139 [Firmicutes bacterium ADurb.Bin419]|nr:MAG: hypothetical protein BWY74_03139 [Firmicutes bacterium ADurb.Bin419]
MKYNSFIVTGIIVVVTALSGYQVMAKNNLFDKEKYKQKLTNINHDIKRENKEKKDIVIGEGNNKKNLKYKYTRSKTKEKTSFNVYKDSDGNEYILNEDGDVLGIQYKLELTSSGELITEDDAVKIASEYKKSMSKKSEEYEFISCKYMEDMKRYVVKYSRIISGLKSEDDITIWVSESGKIIAFIAPNKGKLDKRTKNNFNYSKSIKNLEDRIKEKFGEAYAGYSINDVCVVVSAEGDLQSSFNIDVKIKEKTDDGEILTVIREDMIIDDI